MADDSGSSSDDSAGCLHCGIHMAMLEEADDGKLFTSYVIDVRTGDGSYSWELRRRFSEFVALADTLENIDCKVDGLPPRRFFPTAAAVIEERVVGLHAWLSDVVDRLRFDGVVFAFLDAARHLVDGSEPGPVAAAHAAVAMASAARACSSQSRASAGASHASPGFWPLDAYDEEQLMMRSPSARGRVWAPPRSPLRSPNYRLVAQMARAGYGRSLLQEFERASGRDSPRSDARSAARTALELTSERSASSASLTSMLSEHEPHASGEWSACAKRVRDELSQKDALGTDRQAESAPPRLRDVPATPATQSVL